MNKFKYFFILFLSLFLLCNYSLKNDGLYNFEYFEDDNKTISNVKTYFDGLVYLKINNKILKIFPNSSVEFTESNNYILKEGILLFYDDNLRSTKLCERSDVDIKIFLENQIGKAQFYRLRLPSFLKNLSFDVRIDYLIGKDIKSINTKLHFISNNNNYNYYGFFIPINLYWDIESYSIHISMYRYNKLFGHVITKNIVYQKKWLKIEQQVNFNRTKSNEIARLDREKYNNEKKERSKIWNENNSLKYFLSGFNYPVNDIKYITSEFGLIRIQRYHNGKILSKHVHDGIDIANDKGTPIYAPADGIIRYAKNVEIYGNMIIIEHGFSLFTDYAHLDEIFVKEGQVVKKGDIIGAVGNTGWSTGPHLHWEARLNGISIDPRAFFSIEDILMP